MQKAPRKRGFLFVCCTARPPCIWKSGVSREAGINGIADAAAISWIICFAAYAAPTRLSHYRESLCRAWLGTTAPSLSRSEGEGRGGVGFALSPSPARGVRRAACEPKVRSHSNDLALAQGPGRGAGVGVRAAFAGKAPAEHGSALQPPPFLAAKGRPGRGRFCLCRAPNHRDHHLFIHSRHNPG